MINQWILGHTIFRQTRPERHSTWVKIGVWTSTEILPKVDAWEKHVPL